MRREASPSCVSFIFTGAHMLMCEQHSRRLQVGLSLVTYQSAGIECLIRVASGVSLVSCQSTDAECLIGLQVGFSLVSYQGTDTECLMSGCLQGGYCCVWVMATLLAPGGQLHLPTTYSQ